MMEMGTLNVCSSVKPECPRDFWIVGQAAAVEVATRQFPEIYVAH